MARTLCAILLLTVLLWGCAAPPRQELLTARTALARAEAAEARVLAPDEYRAASSALRDGEELIRRKKYRLAQQILPLAESYAHKALIRAREEQVQHELKKIREQEARLTREAEAASAEIAPAERPAAFPPPKKNVIAKRPVTKPVVVLPASYRVRGGETLWTIAARKDIYSDALLWPLIYQANRDQIKDPRQIYPGQTLAIPRQVNHQDLQEARTRARESKIFPIGDLVH